MTAGVMGRPIEHTNEQLLAIIERHAGGEHILDILEEPDMPGWSTFHRRCISVHTAPEEIRVAYQRAHEAWVERYVLQSPRIAETTEVGETRTTKEWGVEVKTEDMLGHRALKVKTRQWFADRMLERIARANAARHPGYVGGVATLVPAVYISVVDPRQVGVAVVTAQPTLKGNGHGRNGSGDSGS